MNKNFFNGFVKLTLILFIAGVLGVKIIDFNNPFSYIIFILICGLLGKILSKLKL